jgi:hypothetical protein
MAFKHPNVMNVVQLNYVSASPSLRAEGCKSGAKQKAFVTGFAGALSPASYGRRKSPIISWGAFSAPASKAGEEGWKGGILFTHPECPADYIMKKKWRSPPRRA